MKTKTLRFCSRSGLTTASLFLVASLGLAQPDPQLPRRPGAPPEEGRRDRPDAPRGERPFPDRPPGERPPGGSPSSEFRRDVLTEDQRASLREAMESVREESMELGERMRDARNALQEAIYAEKPDPKEIKRRAAEVGEIEGQMSVVRSQALSKIRPELSAEQREQLKRMPPEFAMRGPGMFGGPGGPGGPGGFGPRRENFDGPPRRPAGERPPGEPEDARPRRPRPEDERN
jgi:Spy/CpxP family protein refolding chaperone